MVNAGVLLQRLVAEIEVGEMRARKNPPSAPPAFSSLRLPTFTLHNQYSTSPSLSWSTLATESYKSCPTTCLINPIHFTMLETILQDLLSFITTIINGSIISSHVLTTFKRARISPILKKHALDPSDISDYRPVLLLSFLTQKTMCTNNTSLPSLLCE